MRGEREGVENVLKEGCWGSLLCQENNTQCSLCYYVNRESVSISLRSYDNLELANDDTRLCKGRRRQRKVNLLSRAALLYRVYISQPASREPMSIYRAIKAQPSDFYILLRPSDSADDSCRSSKSFLSHW